MQRVVKAQSCININNIVKLKTKAATVAFKAKWLNL